MSVTLLQPTHDLWAKKETINSQQYWLPLVTHLTDTMYVIDWLYDNWLSPAQRKLIQDNLTDPQIHQIVKFLGFFHDFGKATPAFQTKPSYSHDPNLDQELLTRLLHDGFTGLDQFNFNSPDVAQTPHAKASEALLERAGLTPTLGAVLGAHHGVPLSASPLDNISIYSSNYYQFDTIPASSSSSLWSRTRHNLLDYGLSLIAVPSLDTLPDITQTQAILLTGLLIMADWLASTERLTSTVPLFPLVPISVYPSESSNRFARALTHFPPAKHQPSSSPSISISSTNPDAALAPTLSPDPDVIPGHVLRNQSELNQDAKSDHQFTANPESAPNPDDITQHKTRNQVALNQDATFNQSLTTYFKTHFNFVPRPVQRLILTQLSQVTNPGLIVIEAGCGTGKTETALTAAHLLSRRTGHNGLFFALPTQATTDSMFDRVHTWLNHSLPQSSTHPEQFTLNLMHAKAQLNAHAHLPQARNVSSRNAVVANDWFTGKKSILVQFNVATIDNLLTMALKQRHLFLKHLALSGKIVIIDEIHAYDSYMNSYLTKVLRWLGTYHVPIIALSATLPAAKRLEFFKAYTRGKYRTKPNIPSQLSTDAYPLLTYLDGPTIHQFTDFPKSESHQVTITRLQPGLVPLLNQLKESLSDGGVAGVIVNTVARAQQINDFLSTHDFDTLVLHSAFIATDRIKQESKLVSLIGKAAHRPRRLVVIGTQVLSQSLDIDFDVLFSDLAPMDAIIQRLGRLHRHPILRPTPLVHAQLFLLDAITYGSYGPSKYVYNQYYLLKTDYFLPSRITLPDDSSRLVQLVYDPDTDSQVPDLDKFRLALSQKLRAKRQKAQVFQIDRPRPIAKPIFNWLSNPPHDANSDLAAQASVRDIPEQIEVILLKHLSDNTFATAGQDPQPVVNLKSFQLASQTIKLPHALIANPKQTEELAGHLTKQTHQLFPTWQDDSYLHNTIALVLDSNNQVEINGYLLKYSTNIGLTCKRLSD